MEVIRVTQHIFIWKLKIIPIENANEILKYSLVKSPIPIDWNESKDFESISVVKENEKKEPTIAN